MKKKVIIWLCCLCLTTSLWAVKTDSIAPLQYCSLWHFALLEHRDNPAVNDSLYSQSYSSLSASLHLERANQPFFYQLGTAKQNTTVGVSSYIYLPSNMIVWGNAGYERGKNKDIRFNSTSDYTLIYPYVLGDTIGGKTHVETYSFAGGTAFHKKRWTFGASITCRAMQEYRQTDPRMRGIVTNLVLQLGAKYAFKYNEVALGIGSLFYKQTNDVDFYREEGGNKEYLFTGLDTYNERFSGGNKELYYKATGYQVELNVIPKERHGAFITGVYQYVPYTQILTKLNALPLNTLYFSNGSLVMGWRNNKYNRWSVYGQVMQQKRLGDEHIAGDASGGEYKQLTSLTLYHQVVRSYALNALYHKGNQSAFTTKITIGYKDYNETYEKKERSISFSKLYGEVSVQWQKVLNKRCFFSCSLNCGYESVLQKNMIMPYLKMTETITQLVNITYARLTDNYLHVKGEALVWYYPKSWNKKGYFFGIENTFLESENYNKKSVIATMGVAF